jgi:hypothetical protein
MIIVQGYDAFWILFSKMKSFLFRVPETDKKPMPQICYINTFLIISSNHTMNAALCNIAPKAGGIRSCSASKPLTSSEVRAFAAPSGPATHVSHSKYTIIQQRLRFIKVKSTPFSQTRLNLKF